MTELSFLVDLLLNHKLPKATRDLVASRIRDVERGLGTVVMTYPAQAAQAAQAQSRPLPPQVASQVPSMQAIMMRNQDLIMGSPVAPELNGGAMPPTPPSPEPVAVVAQTPAAVAALNSRQQAIQESLNGKIDKQTGRPRKF